MRQSAIYQVTVAYKPSVRNIRSSEPEHTYYSNLKRTVEAIQTTLLVNGWDASRTNYSAIYRALKERGKYVEDFAADGIKFFQLTIHKLTLNPTLTTLGIDVSPQKQN